MIEILKDFEEMWLAEYLQDESRWKSVFVNYHSPFVERLWTEWGPYRVNLHRIHPCTQEEALFHPHPWPSAMKILSGEYEMAIGFSAGEIAPPVAATVVLVEGASYEMTHPDGWHFVRPIGAPAMSLMVTGKPWERSSPGKGEKLSPLSAEQKQEIFSFFRERYK